MSDEPAAWLRCNSCKGDIGFEEVYYVCSVSTCTRGATDLRFCSVECWDVHVPVMRHRDAWAVEKRSPKEEDWKREKATASADEPPRSISDDEEEPAELTLRETDLPHDILVVVSKLKAYIRARSGMNTSDGVTEVLSDRLRRFCDDAVRHAARDGRKTVMDRDFRAIV